MVVKRVGEKEEQNLKALQSERCPYLVTPLCIHDGVAVFPRWSGSDVWTHCVRTRTSLPAGAMIRLLQHICIALKTIHRKGFCHCDIKPTNILCVDAYHRFGLADAGAMTPQGSRLHEISPTFAGPVACAQGVAAATDDFFALVLTALAICHLRKPQWTHAQMRPPHPRVFWARDRVQFLCPTRGAAAFAWPPTLWTRAQQCAFQQLCIHSCPSIVHIHT